MSVRDMCQCDKKTRPLAVTQYKCNHSAFNGYHCTASDYSEIMCCICGQRWRTKASYVDGLPMAPSDWWKSPAPYSFGRPRSPNA